MQNGVKIDQSWYNVLKDEFEKEYFQKLKLFLVSEKQNFIIYPNGNLIFNAFDSTPFDKVKVVLLGQDPYHGAGQAHGLCFSVPAGITFPPSLNNIFKELKSDIPNFEIPLYGNLDKWAKQGILLLNATLTVRANQAASHQNKGWEIFTDTVIKKLSDEKEHLVFLLWGRYAQAKENLINQNKHLILKAAHPSPLSAYNGFFGCKHFSKLNEYLIKNNIKTIDFSLGDF